MAKIVEGYIKLQVPAGKANPAPPIGTALGPKGLNLMEFCKAFNAQTSGEKPGVPLPIVITYYKDKSFTFVVKTPPVSYFLKEASKVTKGSSAVGKGTFVGEINWNQILEIAKIKMKDMNANDLEAAARMIAGSAVSMGIKVIK